MNPYGETIHEHFRHPRNYGSLEAPDIQHEEVNPLCGDRIRIEVSIGADGTVQAARFQDRLFIAGPTGLLEYDPQGSFLHQYSAGAELPGSPLIALSPAVLADATQPELILATAGAGLLAFNGRDFRQILPSDAEARDITCILPVPSGHLLFGTRKRGVQSSGPGGPCRR